MHNIFNLRDTEVVICAITFKNGLSNGKYIYYELNKC